VTNAVLNDVRSFLKTKVGLDVTGVRDEQLERRIANFLRRNNLKPEELIGSLGEEGTLDRFLDSLTINVTSLFRNADRWQQVAKLLPELGRVPKFWSAGCSKGAEAYTMAMLCAEAGMKGEILATDIDNRILATAVEGIFSEAETREMPPAIRDRYMTKVDGGYRVERRISSMVTFKRHDLLAGATPGKNFDMIACRNVAIYFSQEAKNELHGRLVKCLRPGGYLFIGSTERVDDPVGLGLESASPFIYQNTAVPVRRPS
jgi:chemotaxis protein methyltransferase CheR